MDKYIKREEAILARPEWRELVDDFSAGFNICIDEYIDRIDEIPAADVVPARHGCWNADKEDVEWGNSLIRYRCSICKKRPPFDKEEYKFILSPYCPNCGAKMES